MVCKIEKKLCEINIFIILFHLLTVQQIKMTQKVVLTMMMILEKGGTLLMSFSSPDRFSAMDMHFIFHTLMLLKTNQQKTLFHPAIAW